MSSKWEYARQELVTKAAELNGQGLEEFSHEEWQTRLDEAQEWLEKNPSWVTDLAFEWVLRTINENHR